MAVGPATTTIGIFSKAIPPFFDFFSDAAEAFFHLVFFQEEIDRSSVGAMTDVGVGQNPSNQHLLFGSRKAVPRLDRTAAGHRMINPIQRLGARLGNPGGGKGPLAPFRGAKPQESAAPTKNRGQTPPKRSPNLPTGFPAEEGHPIPKRKVPAPTAPKASDFRFLFFFSDLQTEFFRGRHVDQPPTAPLAFPPEDRFWQNSREAGIRAFLRSFLRAFPQASLRKKAPLSAF